MDKVKNFPASFAGKTGKFYIRQRKSDGSGYLHRTTVWDSVEAFNSRTGELSFCDIDDAYDDFSHEVKIHPETLSTNWPAERDETDLGLTPVRNLWAQRFQLAKEGQYYAA
jgi:hypothetical protein